MAQLLMQALRPRRPRGCKSYEVVEDRKDDENTEASEKAMVKEVVKPNVDAEARWIKKRGKLHFGYKRHTVTDENGMVLAEETTAANESDIKHLETPLKRPLHSDWCVFCLLIHCIIGSYFVYLSIKNSIILLPWHTNPRIPMSM